MCVCVRVCLCACVCVCVCDAQTIDRMYDSFVSAHSGVMSAPGMMPASLSTRPALCARRVVEAQRQRGGASRRKKKRKTKGVCVWMRAQTEQASEVERGRKSQTERGTDRHRQTAEANHAMVGLQRACAARERACTSL